MVTASSVDERLARDEPFADGEFRQVDHAMNLQLFHDLGFVIVDGTGADFQQVAAGPRGVALREAGEYFGFANRQ
ncbi:MAG: hypothetical protein QM775_04175 [Pirellulales bacterium]